MIDPLYIHYTGTILAILGSFISIIGSGMACYGVWVFNIRRNPVLANHIWCISNPMLFIWAIGFMLGVWDGGLLPIGSLALMYGYYTLASWWAAHKQAMNV